VLERFMMVPRSTMEKDLKSQERALTDDINSLGKKVTFPWTDCGIY